MKKWNTPNASHTAELWKETTINAEEGTSGQGGGRVTIGRGWLDQLIHESHQSFWLAGSAK